MADLIKMAAVASVLLTLGLVLLMAGIGFVIEAVRRRHTAAAERPLYDPEPPQRMPVAPDAQRRAVQPAHTEAFERIIRAEFTDYGHSIADHYDKGES